MIGAGEAVAVAVVPRLPELGVDVALGCGVSVALLVVVILFDAVGDTLGVAVLRGGFVELGDLVFVAADLDVEVVEGAGEFVAVAPSIGVAA